MLFRRFKHIAAALIVVFAFIAAAAPAMAGGHGNNDGQNEQTSGMSAEQAASIVQRAYGGRIVSVKPAGGGYNVRVLLDGGRVKTVQVDANGRLHESN
jgi:uncharacterized membrane protein YkoI